ncbi:hypothetical protein AVEN_69556-1 [Araneus ventricosus]|uniref:Uncharacterized protein n=2 Tax=Araneus ventricosus TaxID=182803 RepID=A0A4Y2KJU9_ARAVE|nr:hypothetical protein AVEN_69556-1 [Araneus ventricosus]
MLCRSPVLLILRFERECYGGKYGMPAAPDQPGWTPDLGDKLGVHFGNLATNLATNRRFPKMSASWKACELRAIESAVTVIISDLLTVCVAKSDSVVIVITSKLLSVCVANLYKSYCTCYRCFVFS